MDSGDGKLLNDIETISKALYLNRTKSRSLMSSTASSRSKSIENPRLPEPKSKHKEDNKDVMMEKDKKSIWNWKGFKALTHARDRRFLCYFSLHVHCIEGLPPFFDDLSLVVHWKRRDGELRTRPAMVSQGIAEFEEQLVHSCSVYGRSGTHHTAKYEAKHFLLYASIYGTPKEDLGKQRVDLTRLLPLTLEELDEDKSSGKWTTSYRLSGKAEGGIINVSFGYEVVGNNRSEPSAENAVSRSCSLRQNGECRILRQTESVLARSSSSNRSLEDIKDLHEVFPVSKSELSDSITMLYKKLDKLELEAPEEVKKQDSYLLSDTDKENENVECDSTDFSTIDKGSEFRTNKSEENPLADTCDSTGTHEAGGGVLDLASEEDTEHLSSMEVLKGDSESKDFDVNDKESLMKELESALTSVLNLGNDELDSSEDEISLSNIENHQEMTPKHMLKGKKSINLDDATTTVANEFLDLLGIEHSPFGLSSESEPESPRERLLRQFEKDTLSGGFSLFGTNEMEMETGFDTQTESSSGVFAWGCESSEELFHIETEAMSQKTKASILEDMETEALMHEWGLDEKAFQGSPPSGFGSPIGMIEEVPDQLPSLGQGLGPFVQTKSGEFIRSMNPGLFKNSKNGGSLIMQASRPVVMPAEMGSGVMDILQSLASIGIEKLSMQANKLMPLEDINGNTIQQIAWEATPTLDGPDRDDTLFLHESGSGQETCNKTRRIKGKKKSNSGFQSNSEYVSFEDLAPMAIDKIEALAIEGLKIQSGMSNDVASTNINQQSIGEFSALEGKNVFSSSGSIGLEGSGGLQLLDIKNNGDDDDVDGLMGLSLTLDEWMRLDAGDVYDDDDDQDYGIISERTSKLLAAHHSKSLDSIRGSREKRRSKGRNFGLLGNNFNVALMVQLRDPLRNYEPVGAPMLAVIQVERVFIPPKPRIYSSVSELRYNNEEDEDTELSKNDVKEEEEEERIVEEQEHIPQFKITEVHVAGLKTEPVKNKLWGSTTQQQSGSRWLLANGMGKKNKHSFMKSKANPKSSLPESGAEKTGDALWSVSSSGTGMVKDNKVNSHSRNPEIPLRKEASWLQRRTGFLGFI